MVVNLVTKGNLKGYEIKERIGAGGFGVVYRAYQISVGREVALKVILPDFANQPDFIRRFEGEAQIVARLEHPYITPLYDYWRDMDGAYLVMRWLRGGSLSDALQKGKFELRAAALLLDQIADALSLAHRNGIVHRDIKPANILLDDDGNIYITDFGIAKDLNLAESNTLQDSIIGSVDYISPEQAHNQPVTPRTDIYSLGVTMYEVLTGQHPFANMSAVERLYKHINDPLPEITSLDLNVASDINRVIQTATAKNPEHRYPDTLAFAAEFRAAMGFNRMPSDVVESLTPREHEILHLIIDGFSNKDIAQHLTVSLSTVKWHINQIYNKLGVRSRVQAIIRAREMNLIVKPSETFSSLPIPTEDFHPQNPYKGLHAFQSADYRDFFGREKITDRLISRMGETGEYSRFLAVVGPSGSGKSSLVKAGLIPAIWRGDLQGSEKWFVVEMLPGSHPLEELEIGLTKVAANQSHNLREQLLRDKRGLLRTASLILPNDDSQLVLIIDQFEEVFTLIDIESERKAFLDLLHTAVTDSRSRVRVVVTLRADFYDRPLNYPEFGELVHHRLEAVMPLAADELERAILRPAEQVGISFEPGLVSSIVADVNYQPGALPLLQYALTELFERRQGRVLSREAYQSIGGTIGALARQADELYIALNNHERELVRQMFLRLVTLGEGTEDTRRRTPRSELLAIATDSDSMDDIIDNYTSYWLLALDTDPSTRNPIVEVAHEALLREWEQLRVWLNKSREEIKLQRQLAAMAADWSAANREPSYLAHGSRSEQFERWAAETNLVLTPAEREYLTASVTERKRQIAVDQERKTHEARLERRSRNFLLGLVIVFAVAAVIALGLTLFALDQEGQAQVARAASDSNANESQQLALISGAQAALATGDTDLALALSTEVNQRTYASSQAQIMLAQAAYAPGTIRRIQYQDAVTDVVFSPDGHLAASASADKTIYIWKVETGEVLHQLRGHTDGVNTVTFSPDGRTLISASADTTLILWDVKTGAVIRKFLGHKSSANCVAFSPDGQTALSGSDDGMLVLWNVETGKSIQQLSGHTHFVTSVVFHPDGRRVLSGSWDGTMRLWDIETGDTIRIYKAGVGEINRSVFTPDGSKILMASGDTADIFVWDTETGEVIRRLKGHDGTAISLAIHPNGHFALSGAWDDVMILWDLDTGEMLHRFQGHTHGITGLDFSPDGRYALSGALDKTVRLWDLLGGQVVRRFYSQNGQSLQWILQTRFSPDGHYALTSSIDTISVLWNVATGSEIRRFVGRNTTFASDGSTAIFGTGGWYDPARPGSLRFVNPGKAQEFLRLDFADAVRDLVSAPDGKSFAASFTNTDVKLMNATTGSLIRTFDQSASTGVIAFSPDGSLLAGNTDQINVSIWDVHTGRKLSVFKGHTAFFEGITFSPDGRHLLTASFDNSVIVWDVATGNILWQFKDHSASAFKSIYSPDGKLIVSGSADRTLIVWDAERGQMLRRFTGLHTGIYSLAFSPDGNQLLVGYVDGTLELWHVDPTEDLIAWTKANRYIPELTCEQRQLYHLEPLCKKRIA